MGEVHQRHADERGDPVRQSRLRVGRRRSAAHDLGQDAQAISASKASRRSTPCRFSSTPPIPNVKTIKDFTEKDRIALPAVRSRSRPSRCRWRRRRRSARPGRQARRYHRFARPSGRNDADDERQVRNHRTFHLGAVPVSGARRQARAQGARQLRGAGRPAHLQRRVGDDANFTTRIRVIAGIHRRARRSDEAYHQARPGSGRGDSG